MAASERVSGYQCQFISEVSDELFCGTCRLVAREPHITDCCGEHFCKACISRVLDTGKPCPVCKAGQFTTFLNKRVHKKILSLQAHCTMKDRGCEWVGKLEDLQAHLLVDTNDCQYVDIQCPDKCGESVPRHQLPSHLADSCLNRDYFCKYCNFSATYRVVCYDHWPKCLHYPVQCPNACSVGAVERGDLEDHMKVCLQQEVLCELSHAGCKETFLREDQDRHMEENTQKHLLLMSTMSQRMCQEFEQKFQKQREEREEEITQTKQEFEQKLQTVREEMQEKDDQILVLEEKREQELKALREEKDKQINELQAEVRTLKCQLETKGIIQMLDYPNRSTPPVNFTLNNFNKLKTSDEPWISPDLYTHEGGYKINFKVWCDWKKQMFIVPLTNHGGYDEQLKWPANAIITLQVINQCGDHNHITKTAQCQWEKPAKSSQIEGWILYILHADLPINRSKQTQYLKNDCLILRLTSVELQ